MLSFKDLINIRHRSMWISWVYYRGYSYRRKNKRLVKSWRGKNISMYKRLIIQLNMYVSKRHPTSNWFCIDKNTRRIHGYVFTSSRFDQSFVLSSTAHFIWSVYTKQGRRVVLYMSARGLDLFSTILGLHFGTVQLVYYCLLSFYSRIRFDYVDRYGDSSYYWQRC
jgi:hypothetical protein